MLNRFKNKNYFTYGFNKDSNYQIVNVKKNINNSIFDLQVKSGNKKIYKVKNLKINLLGNHNISNATASIAVALNLGIKINRIKKALKKKRNPSQIVF